MKEELVGFDVLEESIIKCGDCGFPLIEIVKIETNENRLKRGLNIQKSKYKIKCPQCSGYSFDTKIFEGSIIIGSVKDNYIVSAIDTELLDYKTRDDINKGNVVIYTILELVNKK